MHHDAREKCGLFGIFDHPDAVQLTYLGLYALQHRGQESAGIVSTDGDLMKAHRGMGLVGDVFNDARLKELEASRAVGHVRYSTTGSSNIKNAQPLVVDYSRGSIAVAHNGNLTNAAALRDELEALGSIFQTTSDSEIIIHILARQHMLDLREALMSALGAIEGAFSLILMTPDQLIGIRDPRGFRPLCLGVVDGATVLASESSALDLVNAKFVREIQPGEVIFISKDGIESIYPFTNPGRKAYCIFEDIYFARPDSFIFGENVHEARKKLGRALAREYPVEADLVIAIPDTGNSAAIGYAQESGLPFDLGITRNHYVGRTFLQPRQAIRDFGVKVKLNPVRETIAGKRLIVVEDSIVRGTTSVKRMDILREAGASEIHLRISCPPHRYPCYYGIDFPTRAELIAASKSVQEIADHLGVDSLGYLSLEGMLGCMKEAAEDFCTACFDGKYPVPIDGRRDKFIVRSDRQQEKLNFP